MATLPTPGANDVWGNQLNTWLQVAHNADGTSNSSGSGGLAAQYGETSTTWTQSTTDNTTWIPGTSSAGQWTFQFTAPTTGIVYITYSAYIRAGTGSGVLTSYDIKNGSNGSSFQAVGAAGTKIVCNDSAYASGSVTKKFSGLTPGTPYILQTRMLGQGNTTTTQNIDFRSFLVLG